MREIVFDTETTGLSARDGHRLAEFAGVELVDRVPTGRVLHLYINPERSMPAEAEAIHGLSTAFLEDKPRFAQVADQILAFIEGAVLVAHNAGFDMAFLNAELERAGRSALTSIPVIDTLDLARQALPGAKHTLDALCTRFGIDRSMRVKHGALIDAELLAEVYVELRGGRQIGMDLAVSDQAADAPAERVARPARGFPLPPEEEAAHIRFVSAIGGSIWAQHIELKTPQ